MPCVLPVIALKILGFVNQGGNHPRTIRKLGFVYAAGVLVSFLVLAGLIIAVEKAGRHAQVGMQFSDPKFIVAMAVLITLVALNLFGVFEINLSGKIMGAAGQLSAREGTSGAFFNGILATILATPCTAAYLAPALGFAFSQPYQIVVLVLLTVGLGLAAPYVVLSCNPAWLKLLPKPGAWMEKFKIAMGFPMLATAVWLCNLAATFYGDRVLWLALFLVMLALAAWIYGEFVQRGRARKGLAATIAVLILAGGYAYAIEGQLHWRSPIQETSPTEVASNSGDIDWQPWSVAAVADARAAGHPVLVDFTAKWCLICQVNRKSSIEIKSVEDKLKELKAVALIADDTKLPEDIGAELNRYGRAGVPLIVVFPAIQTAPPIVLPDGLLTPGIVLDALDKAAAK
jgi:thiol:disulfide interchange protein